jgi:hypothetical protein
MSKESKEFEAEVKNIANLIADALVLQIAALGYDDKKILALFWNTIIKRLTKQISPKYRMVARALHLNKNADKWESGELGESDEHAYVKGEKK